MPRLSDPTAQRLTLRAADGRLASTAASVPSTAAYEVRLYCPSANAFAQVQLGLRRPAVAGIMGAARWWTTNGARLRGLIVVLWRAGLRVSEALALAASSRAGWASRPLDTNLVRRLDPVCCSDASCARGCL